MADEIILYDIPTRGKPTCWSLNPWKTRAALNYKKLPYRTEWVEYPDLAPTFKALGIPPNSSETNIVEYSSPAIRFPDGRLIMDSRAIAAGLEAFQPSPPLHLDSPYLKRVEAIIKGLMPPLTPNTLPLIPEKILNPRSAEYFERTRAKRFGMPLQELFKSDKGGEVGWKAAEPHIETLRTLLAEQSGPFVEGQQITYADIVLGGLLVFYKTLDEKALFDRFVSYDKSFGDLWESVQPWFERNDH